MNGIWAQIWKLWEGVALVCAALFFIYVLIQLASWGRRDPRGLAHALCGELALVFALLALIWGVTMLP